MAYRELGKAWNSQLRSPHIESCFYMIKTESGDRMGLILPVISALCVEG